LHSDEARGSAESQNNLPKSLASQGQDQGTILTGIQNQLQDIVSSRVHLFGEVDAASREYKHFAAVLTSQVSQISHLQTRDETTLDNIHAGVVSVESSMGRVENEMKETIEQLSGNAFKQLASSCLKALFVTEPSVDRKEIETRKDKLIDRSCDWILPQFWEFLGSDLLSRLWIHGAPGKGKTMI
jgi:hypothetical protein